MSDFLNSSNLKKILYASPVPMLLLNHQNLKGSQRAQVLNMFYVGPFPDVSYFLRSQCISSVIKHKQRKSCMHSCFHPSSIVLFYGEPFQAWGMWLSPHSENPVGSEVGGQDPPPWIGSSVGSQACIVPRPL